MRKYLRLLTILAALIVAVLATGCGREPAPAEPAPQPKQEPVEVKVGVLRLASSAPIFIGIEQGFFASEGITVKPVWFDAAQPVAVATASGEIDVGATGLTAGLYNLAAGGQVPLIVADKGRETAEFPSSYLVVTKEAYEAGVRTLPDLVGKKVGNTQAGSTYQYMLGNLLEQEKLSLDQVEFANLGKLNAIMAALQSRQITAAILNEPHATRMQTANYVVAIEPIGKKLKYQTSAIFYSPQFAAKEDIALRFMRAYIKACRHYHDVIFGNGKNMATGPVRSDPDYQALIKIIGKYTMTPDNEVANSLPYIDRDGHIDSEDIAKQIAWYRSHGYMQQDLDPAKVVRTDFWQKAIDSLQDDQ